MRLKRGVPEALECLSPSTLAILSNSNDVGPPMFTGTTNLPSRILIAVSVSSSYPSSSNSTPYTLVHSWLVWIWPWCLLQLLLWLLPSCHVTLLSRLVVAHPYTRLPRSCWVWWRAVDALPFFRVGLSVDDIFNLFSVICHLMIHYIWQLLG